MIEQQYDFKQYPEEFVIETAAINAQSISSQWSAQDWMEFFENLPKDENTLAKRVSIAKKIFPESEHQPLISKQHAADIARAICKSYSADKERWVFERFKTKDISNNDFWRDMKSYAKRRNPKLDSAIES